MFVSVYVKSSSVSQTLKEGNHTLVKWSSQKQLCFTFDAVLVSIGFLSSVFHYIYLLTLNICSLMTIIRLWTCSTPAPPAGWVARQTDRRSGGFQSERFEVPRLQVVKVLTDFIHVADVAHQRWHFPPPCRGMLCYLRRELCQLLPLHSNKFE